MDEIARFEADREFCRHDMGHLVDVARIMYIVDVEMQRGYTRSFIYVLALLHDIGRAEQYRTGEPHDEAGARIAAEILRSMPDDLAFSAEEQEAICAAIKAHRVLDDDVYSLGHMLYAADKKSRACYACAARPRCNWPRSKMNLSLDI